MKDKRLMNFQRFAKAAKDFSDALKPHIISMSKAIENSKWAIEAASKIKVKNVKE